MRTANLIASCMFCLQTAPRMCSTVNNSWACCGYLQVFDWLRAVRGPAECWNWKMRFVTGRSQLCIVKNKLQYRFWHEQLDIIDVVTLDSGSHKGYFLGIVSLRGQCWAINALVYGVQQNNTFDFHWEVAGWEERLQMLSAPWICVMLFLGGCWEKSMHVHIHYVLTHG